MAPIILIAAIVCFLYYYCTRSFSYWRNKKVAGPKPIPFFGNLRDSALRRKHLGIVYKEIYDQFPNESIIGFYRMTSPALIVRDLDIVKDILIKDFDIFPERGVEFGKEGLGDNLFHCNSTTWKALRNRLTPLFTSGKLKNTVSLLDRYADQLVNYLETTAAGNKEQEMHNVFKKYTMASIMSISYGLDIDFFKENQKLIEETGHYVFRSTYAAEVDMLIPNIWRRINLSLYPKLVNKFSYEVVQTARSQKSGVSTIRNDLIDAMLAMKKEQEIETTENGDQFIMTDHVMAGQVFIFFAAGFGNNALSLSYALFQLAKHQDVQNKLIQEVDEVLAKFDGKLTYNAIKEMPYLDKVFSEILRMNTLTNSIQRSAKKDYNVPGTDIVIDKGTTVIISPYAIHRDGDLYPDPDHFDPERFSPINSANRHPCAYLPFGVGPRSCIGRQLAKLQFFAAITKIFSKFRVEPSEKTRKIEDYEPMNTLLATRGGIWVNLVPRNL